MKKTLAWILTLAMTASVALTGCGAKEEKPADPAAAGSETPAATPAETPAASPAGTSSAELTGTTLVWNIGAESKTYDPTLNSSTDGSSVINNTFEGLMRNKNDGKGLQPAIAAEAPIITDNADGSQTYVFKLKDTKWSDGQPLTAKDFVFSWKRLVDPITASEFAYMASPILNADEITKGEKPADELGVKAIDDKTLEVTLKQPTGFFLELTSVCSLMPLREDIVGKDTEGLWAKDPAKAVSNGPFVLTKYTMGSDAIFSKNPEYWDAANVKVDNIIGKMISDPSTALTGFRNGEIAVSDIVPAEELQQLAASGECQMLPGLGNQFYVINQNTEIEALKNVKVRQALSMAIDRKAIVDNVSRGGQKPIGGIVPYGLAEPDGKDYREKTGNFYLKETADVEGAKKLLAEAGFPEGQGIPEIEILYNTSENIKAVAEAIQEMWKAIGVTAKLSNQEWAVFQDTRFNANYPALARHAWNADYTDPQTFMDIFMSGNVQSGCAYANPAFDAEMQKAMKASGQERFDSFRTAEKILIEDAYVIPIYASVKAVLAAPTLQNWSMNPLGVFWFGDTEVLAA